MTKAVYETFDDHVHQKLSKAKGADTWKQFILRMAEPEYIGFHKELQKFTRAEREALLKAKGSKSWHDFIMQLVDK